MGHSWGSLLGILTAHQHPELFHAYLGVGQLCYPYKGGQIAYEWVKEQAKQRNNQDAAEALAKISYPDSLASWNVWLKFLMVERKYVTQFGGGLTHQMTEELWPVMKMILDTKEYTLSEKKAFLSGNMFFSVYNLWQEVMNTNLFNEIDSMQVPVYIFQGKHDYQTPHANAKDFFDQLKAPQKGFFTFENSAHSPNMEEIDKFNSIVREITRTHNRVDGSASFH
jgi:pimeloyl-ACP methyl ester carboxylesterase